MKQTVRVCLSWGCDGLQQHPNYEALRRPCPELPDGMFWVVEMIPGVSEMQARHEVRRCSVQGIRISEQFSTLSQLFRACEDRTFAMCQMRAWLPPCEV